VLALLRPHSHSRSGNGVHVDRINEGLTTSSPPPDLCQRGSAICRAVGFRVAFVRHLSLD
jgi:hypothetical protein